MQSDHDLLIELKTIVEAIQKDIGEMKDTTRVRVDDHETRLRSIEFKLWAITGAYAIIAFSAPYFWSLFHK